MFLNVRGCCAVDRLWGQEWEQGDLLGRYVITQAKSPGGLAQDNGIGVMIKYADSVCILKVEPTEFLDELNVILERKNYCRQLRWRRLWEKRICRGAISRVLHILRYIFTKYIMLSWKLASRWWKCGYHVNTHMYDCNLRNSERI